MRDWRVLVRGVCGGRVLGCVLWCGAGVQYSTNRSSCRMNIRCGSVSLPDDDTEAAVAVTSIALIILKYYGGATVVDEPDVLLWQVIFKSLKMIFVESTFALFFRLTFIGRGEIIILT